ncbi:hypothetical protein C8F04DRAFT_1239640 [Mycena alexandri]|uniref:Uncharacterized protein n=1 Tax=Mycena alexandri TaxID=1745969 RepID=A0AAD6SBG3_9AGAR|nr:hypothetical protein C8F04DRAFT_1239640 [Mycena alexandri]
MPGSSNLPAGLQFKKGNATSNNNNNNSNQGHNALKRKRETTAGGSAVTQTAYANNAKSSASAKSTADALEVPDVPVQWNAILRDAQNTDGLYLPPTVIKKFVEIREDCLNDFRSAQTWLQKAASTHQRYNEAASTGIPNSVSSNLKMPPVQVMKGAAGIEHEPAVAEARVIAEKAIKSATDEVTKYLAILFKAQLTSIRKLVDVATAAGMFADTLKAYSVQVIADALGTDFEVWSPVIERLKAVHISELQMLNFEFVAAIKHDADVKVAKANVVNTARADAEMTDATRPVTELIEEKIEARYKHLEKKLTDLLQQSSKSSNEASTSSKPPPNSKSKQSTAPAAPAKTKTKKAYEKKKTDATNRENKTKKDRQGNGGGGSHNTARDKSRDRGKGKQRGGAMSETQESDSD